MSRINTMGINPKNGEPVTVSYGYDEVPGFSPGYFFQVFSNNKEDIERCPSGEGMILNEGFIEGISKHKLKNLASTYSVSLKLNI